jgi:peptidyl-dipeptidase A
VSAALDAAEARLAPLEEAANTAHWALATDATDEHAKQAAEAQIAWEEALSDPALRAAAAAASAAAADPIERRRADVLHLAATAHQRPAALRDRIVALETELQGRFSAHRAVVGGREVTDNEIAAILLRSTDVAERREAWLAQRAVGDVIADDLLELIRMRNEAAQALGHRDHYAFSLAMEELDEAWLYTLLDDLEGDLSGLWTAEKAAIDADVRDRLGLAADAELAPWHYADPFFQDPPPPSQDPLLDAVADVDALATARAYFAALGHDVDAILARSDLEPRPGKDQHAFQITVVRGSDIRTLCNLEPTLRWLETLLHELGHAIYDDSVDKSLPWLLRTHSHTFTTEAVAMLHGRRARDHVFLERFAGIAPEIARHPANGAVARRDLLVFAAWVQVMARFERALYADPGQDLVTTWWSQVERYQRLQRPEGIGRGDWAAKIHLTVAPVYYHNYLLGQMTASQLEATVARELGAGSAAANPAAAGELLRERFLRSGARLRWDDHVQAATGAPLTTAAFAAELASR